jgi:hypothetical protein
MGNTSSSIFRLIKKIVRANANRSRSALESNDQNFIHLVAKLAPKLHISVAGPNANVWSRAVTCDRQISHFRRAFAVNCDHLR